jgi:hypothetical protein
MRKKSPVSSSGPFLIELLIGLLIFTLAATICLQVFVGAHQISSESHALNNAIIKAQNGAESFKASGGDLQETKELIGGHLLDDDIVWQYFDSDWNPVFVAQRDADEENAFADFVLEVRQIARQSGYVKGEVVVSDMYGTLIFSLPIAVLEVAP